MHTCEPEQCRSAVKFLCMVYETAYDGVSSDMHHLLCWVMPKLIGVPEA